MSAYIELKINVIDKGLKEILIALLSEAGATGFEEEKYCLKVFIPEDEYNQSEFDEIIDQNGLIYSKSIIKETNWNAEWESGFRPVTVGSFCAVRANFHEPNTTVMYDIIITPKMSFGTGHHSTTYMMIKAMADMEINNKTVFDFGTGTGVLSILAEKCGAKSIVAIDNDEWSISNSMENFNTNNCHKILLYKEEGFVSGNRYDIVLANINRNIILENLVHIKQHLSGNGVVLLSGLLTGDEPEIIEESEHQNLKLKAKTAMNGWICLLLVNE